MNTMLRLVVGGIAGAAVGYALYRFVGCRTGACPLTSNPYTAMLIYGFVGALLAAGR